MKDLIPYDAMIIERSKCSLAGSSMRESFWRIWPIGVRARGCGRDTSLSVLTDSFVVGCTWLMFPPFFPKKKQKNNDFIRSNGQSSLLRIGVRGKFGGWKTECARDDFQARKTAGTS
jgi:hypothetical protein